jgi:hypothetical protein
VTLEGLRLDGNYPIALWSILKPRNAVTVDAAVESGQAQDCVCVNYIIMGRINNTAWIGEGLWTLEIPDHALGRAVERSRMFPDTIITNAHHNLLSLANSAITHEDGIRDSHRFLVKAGDGGFNVIYGSVAMFRSTTTSMPECVPTPGSPMTCCTKIRFC